MRRFVLVLIAVLGVLIGPAQAANSPTCGALPNLACASGTPSTEDISTQFNFIGATAFTLDGATANASKVTVTVTDPTTGRTLTIPNADTAPGQAVSCSAGNHVSAFSATTGAFTCSADTAPNHNLLSASHTDTTAASPTRGDIITAQGASPTWSRLAVGSATQLLHGGTTEPSYTAIVAADIGIGTLSNVLVWNESKTSCSPNCTLANSPRVSSGATPTALLISNGIAMKPVASCGGVNEYTISGTTLTPCDTTNNANLLAYYER